MRSLRHITWAVLTALLAAAMLVVSLPVLTPKRFARATVVVRDDPGGMVSDYIRWLERVADASVLIRIEGQCISACTLVLALPPGAACMLPTAKFGFHLASIDGVPNEEATQELIQRFYPPRVQQWIKDHGPLVSAPTYMLGSEAIELGVIEECI
jgi:hypothetical protein